MGDASRGPPEGEAGGQESEIGRCRAATFKAGEGAAAGAPGFVAAGEGKGRTRPSHLLQEPALPTAGSQSLQAHFRHLPSDIKLVLF